MTRTPHRLSTRCSRNAETSAATLAGACSSSARVSSRSSSELTERGLKGSPPPVPGVARYKGRIRTIMRVIPCACPVYGNAWKLHAPEQTSAANPRGRIMRRRRFRKLSRLGLSHAAFSAHAEAWQVSRIARQRHQETRIGGGGGRSFVVSEIKSRNYE